MTLFFSDLHLGRDGYEATRASERALVDLFDAHPDVEQVYLVGDVFHAYIEYRHLVPKGHVRFLGALARLADRGVRITYLAGNHDPWHRDYFARELGVRVVPDRLEECVEGRRVHLAHGDGLDPDDHAYNLLKPLLRHPVPVWLYRTLLPGDVGYGLARRVSHLGSDEGPIPQTIEALRAYARARLAGAPDVVVLGHAHAAELTALPGGAYLNPGFWHEDRTFGRLDGDGLALLRWNGTCPVEVQRAAV